MEIEKRQRKNLIYIYFFFLLVITCTVWINLDFLLSFSVLNVYLLFSERGEGKEHERERNLDVTEKH